MKRFEARPVAIVGGSRIPFCRANTAYVDLDNNAMMTSALNALVQRFSLQGECIGDVALGAVIKHSSDWNLAREAVLNTDLAPQTPAFGIQRACGTSLDATILIANKIAMGQIEVGIAGGVDTISDVPIVYDRRLGERIRKMSLARGIAEKARVWKGFRLRELKPSFPDVAEPRTGLSMGEHTELMAKEWKIAREDQDRFAFESHSKATAAYDEGFYDELVTECNGVSRDNILRPDTTLEKLASLRPAFDKSGSGTLTAGNSTPLSDGASCALLCSQEWARAKGLPIQAYLVGSKVAAVEFAHDEGLLMAPAYAVSELLRDGNLALQDFDLYEIHEAFAAQVLCTLRAWESVKFCKDRLGRPEPMGSIDRDKLNVVGSSLALGHPFAATGTRIVGTLAKLLNQRGSGRGLISVCTAGGMGVAAILERSEESAPPL